jgi:hypothetical protein
MNMAEHNSNSNTRHVIFGGASKTSLQYGRFSHHAILASLTLLPVVGLATYIYLNIGLILLGISIVLMSAGIFLHSLSSQFGRSESFDLLSRSVLLMSLVIGGFGIWIFLQGIF